MPEPSYPFVSVIIPVFNDHQRLNTCLEALEKQTYPSEFYEIIVVDNGSDESPQAIVGRYPHAALAFESKIGSYAARNKALSLAKGQFLAFTDADCIPQSQWLERGTQRLQQFSPYGIVAGHIEVYGKSPGKLTWLELYDRFSALNQKKTVDMGLGAATGNAFTHLSVFDKVGLFNDSLKSFGDAEWSQRAIAAGLPVVYCAEARIEHPARASLRQIIRRRRRLIGGEQDQKTNTSQLFGSPRLLRVLWYSFVPRLKHLWMQTDDESLKGSGQRMKVAAVLLLMQYVDAFERIRIRLGGESERR